MIAESLNVAVTSEYQTGEKKHDWIKQVFNNMLTSISFCRLTERDI